MWDVLDPVHPGFSACVVHQIRFYYGHTWEAELLALEEEIRIVLLPGTSLDGVYKAPFFGFSAVQDEQGWVWTQREASFILRYRPWNPQTCTCVKEACTGVGVLGFGLSRVGFVIPARNELIANTAGVLKGQGAVPTVVSNICEPKLILAVACANHRPAGLGAGISCQLYSELGGRRQGNDAKASSLPGVPRVGYLLQASFVLLECVSPATTSDFVRANLEAFQKVTRFRACDVFLDLQDVWPAKRNRWWRLLVPSHLPIANLPAWRMPFSS